MKYIYVLVALIMASISCQAQFYHNYWTTNSNPSNGAGLTNLTYIGSNSPVGVITSVGIDIPPTNCLMFNHRVAFYYDSSNGDIWIGQATGAPFFYNSQFPPDNPFPYYLPKPTAFTNSENISIGYGSGQDIHTGSGNVLLGFDAAFQIETGSNNVAIGNEVFLNQELAAMENVIIGDQADFAPMSQSNVVIGALTIQNANANTNVIVLGVHSGNNWDANESYNILIDSLGTAGENDAIHIGDESASGATYKATYLAGIVATPTNATVLARDVSHCYFWPSNYDLYWVTPLKTNLVTLGH